ncbi:MAG TPA: hypothetical protein VK922_01090 [Gemmatimonadaceae bacterium]|nr:hypothetical protein [Gemmatimonadaceae bacterium]
MKRHAPLLLSLAAATACGDAPTSSSEAATSAPTLSAHEFSVAPLWLRSDTEALDAWGVLLVMVGPLHPPNPCGLTLEGASVAVCGVIHNPEGALFTGGTLRITGGLHDVELDFSLPPNPCLAYVVRAIASPDLGGDRLELPAVQVEFTTERGRLATWSMPGPPNLGDGEGFDRTISPDAPPNPCLLEFAADVRDG